MTRSSRAWGAAWRVWAVPAALAGGLTVLVVLALRLVVGGGGVEDLARQRIDLTTSTAPKAPSTAMPSLTLAADGLGVVSFGEPANVVVPRLTRQLGTPDEDAEQPCQRDATQHSRWVRWADLSIRLTDQGFAGYIDGIHIPPGRPPFDFATERGLSIGDLARRLHDVYGNRIPIRTQSPGPDRPATAIFTIPDGPAGTISGVIEGTGGSATVASIFAGELC